MNTLSLSESMPRTGSGSCLPVASGPTTTLKFCGQVGYQLASLSTIAVTVQSRGETSN